MAALRQMDHREAIELLQKALSVVQSPSPLEDSTAEALALSSPSLAFANGETGNADSKTARVEFHLQFQM